jgi:hypothetical protein
MNPKHYIAISICLMAAFTIGLFSWSEARQAREQLQSTLATDKQLLAQLDASERERASNLKDSLEAIAAIKREVNTPSQILRALPLYLPLPQPLTVVDTSQAHPHNSSVPTEVAVNSNSGAGDRTTSAPQANPKRDEAKTIQNSAADPNPKKEQTLPQQLPDAPPVEMPQADLKPLFDFVQDCRACKARLAAAQASLKDEQSRSATLTQERDAAVKAARGGSFWARLKHAATWFAIGVAAGAVATHRLP